MWMINLQFYFSKFLEDVSYFLWGHWYPCLGPLVTSPLGFITRVGSLIFTWWCTFLRFTSSSTPMLVYVASIAASHFPHMCVSAEVGCRIWTGDFLLAVRHANHSATAPGSTIYMIRALIIFTRTDLSLLIWLNRNRIFTFPGMRDKRKNQRIGILGRLAHIFFAH